MGRRRTPGWVWLLVAGGVGAAALAGLLAVGVVAYFTATPSGGVQPEPVQPAPANNPGEGEEFDQFLDRVRRQEEEAKQQGAERWQPAKPK